MASEGLMGVKLGQLVATLWKGKIMIGAALIRGGPSGPYRTWQPTNKENFP